MLYTPAMPEHDGLSQCVVDRVHLILQAVKETKFKEKKKKENIKPMNILQ